MLLKMTVGYHTAIRTIHSVSILLESYSCIVRDNDHYTVQLSMNTVEQKKPPQYIRKMEI